MKRIRPFLQHGFTIVTVIFILVVLAVLGAAIVTVSSMQQVGSALDVQTSRAYQAARTGIEWGAYQIQSTYSFGAGGTADPNTRSCPWASTSFVAPAPTLSGFTITVTCTAWPSPYPDANNSPKIFQIQSTACNAPISGACPGTLGPTYVERRIVATL
ncbi:MAG: agglutinin biogenesis protein MshP [Proteobacteria bacterium]|nr:agglutinin biogenesis protein MshP [Pseudomonadota bacterium]HQR04203.1 hypothetical protein [Rhodocyclaceae bacterium]